LEAKIQINRLVEETSGISSNLEDSQSRIQHLENELLRKEEDLSRLKHELNEAASVSTTVAELNSEVISLRSTLTNKSNELSEASTRIEKLELDITRRTEATKKALGRIKELEKKNADSAHLRLCRLPVRPLLHLLLVDAAVACRA
jgi:chromosome segregation ATPase